MAYIPLREFKIYCQKVLPLVYDDSLSYYEVLNKLIKAVNTLIENVDFVYNEYSDSGETVKNLQADVALLKEELEKVKNGDYVSLYIDSLSEWIDKNLTDFVGRIVKYVFFGLTNDGHFCAYIPESWDFINFDTIVDPTDELYGHLLVRW